MGTNSSAGSGEHSSRYIKTFSQHSATLSQQVRAKWKDNPYTDVTFIIEGQEVRCHKFILAARSIYFNTLFQSKLTPDSGTVNITTIPLEVFKAIVEFIYTGEVYFPDSEIFARELLENADMMDFTDLKCVTAEFFSDRIEAQNCLGFLQMSMTFREPQLEKTCFKYALNHFKDVKEFPEFLEASLEVVNSCLTHADINAVSEEEICKSAIDWLMHKSERKENVYELLSNIRIQDLSLHYIQYNLLSHPLIKENKELDDLLSSVIQNILFLKPLPINLQGMTPRSKTEVVTGLALLGKSGSNYRSVTLLSLCCTDGKYVCKEGKEIPCGQVQADTLSKLAYTIDNCIISVNREVCQGFSYTPAKVNVVYKYDVFRNSWTSLPSGDLKQGELSQIIVAENKEIYRLLYKPESSDTKTCKILSLEKYVIEKNHWENFTVFDKTKVPLFFREENMSLITLKNHVYIFGMAFKKQNMKMVEIIGIDLNGIEETKHMDFIMPQTLTYFCCLSYKQHLLVAGREKCYILSLLEFLNAKIEQENTQAVKEGQEQNYNNMDDTVLTTDVSIIKSKSMNTDNVEKETVSGKLENLNISPTQSASQTPPSRFSFGVPTQAAAEQEQNQSIAQPSSEAGFSFAPASSVQFQSQAKQETLTFSASAQTLGSIFAKSQETNKLGGVPFGGELAKSQEANKVGGVPFGVELAKSQEANKMGGVPFGGELAKSQEANKLGGVPFGGALAKSQEANNLGRVPFGSLPAKNQEANKLGGVPFGGALAKSQEANKLGGVPFGGELVKSQEANKLGGVPFGGAGAKSQEANKLVGVQFGGELAKSQGASQLGGVPFGGTSTNNQATSQLGGFPFGGALAKSKEPIKLGGVSFGGELAKSQEANNFCGVPFGGELAKSQEANKLGGVPFGGELVKSQEANKLGGVPFGGELVKSQGASQLGGVPFGGTSTNNQATSQLGGFPFGGALANIQGASHCGGFLFGGPTANNKAIFGGSSKGETFIMKQGPFKVSTSGLFCETTSDNQGTINSTGFQRRSRRDQENVTPAPYTPFHLKVLGNLMVKLQDGMLSVVDMDKVMENQSELIWMPVEVLGNLPTTTDCMEVVRFHQG